ncbi:VOC family protein [Rivihabitans pingtungensis]|jgi:catechol 2,3-dioxygenase-like lactoylglutathione lyase family enzyme|uniref:Glyoxalase/bleomycin resistance protein/dioxygenase superfamily protein n=1 Tax=Rivihabitans pingtungensis TaxID=1054498 RepID=A0A318KKJ9_9NEIS|nr:VOC family protein [Rivihabitans pingtungensis]MCK6437906.1 VOC family protein [Rivihabitans pingtungensis]PXX78371.1 glyoxalase/bleomycin resistance protein/dioxygenase superfamily protein [Rivihabitans pingtungensis]HNX70638.1 VOC family protein [Rivihabitans pingtungensis]
MLSPDMTILAVADPLVSARFYQSLLGIEPVECQATFAMFVLPSGLKLGLWQREGVAPAVTAEPGSVELAAALADEAALRDCWARWRGLGVEVIQPPTQMDFGLTMTAADPDGHRLRVFVPAM